MYSGRDIYFEYIQGIKFQHSSYIYINILIEGNL